MVSYPQGGSIPKEVTHGESWKSGNQSKMTQYLGQGCAARVSAPFPGGSQSCPLQSACWYSSPQGFRCHLLCHTQEGALGPRVTGSSAPVPLSPNPHQPAGSWRYAVSSLPGEGRWARCTVSKVPACWLNYQNSPRVLRWHNIFIIFIIPKKFLVKNRGGYKVLFLKWVGPL